MIDTAAQAELLLEHGEFVRRLARGLVRDPDRADDVVQETWLAALRNPPRAREAAPAWFRAAARNVAAKLDRGDRRRATREKAVAVDETDGPGAGELVQRLSLQRAAVDAVLALAEPTRTAIVLRYFEELTPTEIAARLGVPRNTVRARLRRGLERLRADLDARHDGDRSRWLAAILPVAGLEDLGLAAAVPSTTTATGAVALAGTLGAWTMTVKGVSSAAAAALLGLAGVSLILAPDGTRAGGPADRAASSSIGDAPLAAAANGFRDDAPTVPPAAAAAPAREEAVADAAPADRGSGDAAPAAPLPEAGSFAIEPLDPWTGRPLVRPVIARFETELRGGRFAVVEAEELPAQARLTGADWTGSIHAPGYETFALEPFPVTPDEEWLSGRRSRNEPLRPRMVRGAGRISGRVRTPAFDPDHEVIVELIGDGRGPCPDCAPRREDGSPDHDAAWTRSSPCGACGYAEDVSRLSLNGGGAFAFRGLAAGGYRVRVRAGEAPVGVERAVVLDRGGHAFVDVELQAPAIAWFELVDEQGQPLFDDREDGGEPTAARFTFRAADAAVAHATYVHRAGRVLPTRVLVNLGRLSSVQRATADQLRDVPATLFVQATATGARDRLDRARKPGDTLQPPTGSPAFPRVFVGAARPDPTGPIRVGPLPAMRLVVTVTAGRRSSEPLEIDLRPGAPTLHRLVLPPAMRSSADALSDVVTAFRSAAALDESGSPLRTAQGVVAGGGSDGAVVSGTFDLGQSILMLTEPPDEESAADEDDDEDEDEDEPSSGDADG